MQAENVYADVILPLSVEGLYTYEIPEEYIDSVAIGKRVIVQFGKQKIYSALVRKLHSIKPDHYKPKEILEVLDSEPMVTEMQFRLWDWVCDYYMCNLGDVMNAALPPALKLQSETLLIRNEDKDDEGIEDLNEKEYKILSSLSVDSGLTINSIAAILGQKSVMHLIKNLIEKGWVILHEEIKDKYKPRLKSYISLHQDVDESKLKLVLDELERRAPKQFELMMLFLKHFYSASGKANGNISKDILKSEKEFSDAAFRTLIQKSILAEESVEVSRLNDADKNEIKLKTLNPAQQQSYDEIRASWKVSGVSLLFGVTSSGKTEVYTHLIQDVIDRGEQVLYLLPEIALTNQLIDRLNKVFGGRVGVYHSGLNSAVRYEVWQKSGNPDPAESYDLILGARSSLFLPFRKLGLIIVDEEHDSSFKQHDPSPRYHARDSAIMLAHMLGAKTLLGSATPSLESWHNAKEGKYGFIKLSERYGGVKMPLIEVVNIREETRKKLLSGLFSSYLKEKITETLKNGEQIILFQNRRGFSNMLECRSCGWVPQCKHCDVSLTYHKQSNNLKCHYCGSVYNVFQTCSACGSTDLKVKGFGTEKVEEEISAAFPAIKVSRMDHDTTRSKKSLSKILEDFAENRVNILVGTQMVTKGLDFDNVNIVGILNADNMINFPDFRSHERAFQLMAQVSGRAGRRAKQGRVIIQTGDPNHHVIRKVVEHDYESFYEQELNERMTFRYPPFYRLIRISLKHKKEHTASLGANKFVSYLRHYLGNERVLGPEIPMVPRVKNYYIRNVLIKAEKEHSFAKVKEIIGIVQQMFKSDPELRPVQIHIDVDPV